MRNRYLSLLGPVLIGKVVLNIAEFAACAFRQHAKEMGFWGSCHSCSVGGGWWATGHGFAFQVKARGRQYFIHTDKPRGTFANHLAKLVMLLIHPSKMACRRQVSLLQFNCARCASVSLVQLQKPAGIFEKQMCTLHPYVLD